MQNHENEAGTDKYHDCHDDKHDKQDEVDRPDLFGIIIWWRQNHQFCIVIISHLLGASVVSFQGNHLFCLVCCLALLLNLQVAECVQMLQLDRVHLVDNVPIDLLGARWRRERSSVNKAIVSLKHVHQLAEVNGLPGAFGHRTSPSINV